MSFHVGQEVVCIKKTPWVTLDPQKGRDIDLPQFGDVLVVADEKIEDDIHFLNFTSQYLDWYAASEFRPVAKTNIQIFQAMLVPCSPEQVPA